MLMPDTWAWDDYDILLAGDDAQKAIAARERAEIVKRQVDKVHEDVAYYTCDSVTIQ